MRETFDLPLKEDSSIGRYINTEAVAPLGQHYHENAIEICYLVSGTQTYCIGEDTYKLISGDYFITQPNQQHSTNGELQERGELIWLILALPKKEELFLNLPKEESKELINAIRGIDKPHFKGDKISIKNWNELWDLQFKGPVEILTKIEIRNQLLKCLLNLLKCSKQKKTYTNDITMEECKLLIKENPLKTFTLEELADNMSLSLSRFKVRFKESVGVAPREFINRVKVDYAKKQLESGDVITKLAHELGYSSSQYFSRIFKKYTRKTPSEWKN
jgi:AraC-like DNA-binding protein/quercetin dioxygenase-like cupin family protein